MSQNRTHIDIEHWQRITKLGNSNFDTRNYDSAICHYLEAKQLAHRIFEAQTASDKATPILVISHSNLAETYQRQSKLDLAYRELLHARALLLKELKALPADSQHSNCIRNGISKTQVELMRFIKDHPNTVQEHLSRTNFTNH